MSRRHGMFATLLTMISVSALAQKALPPPPQTPYGLSISTESAKKAAAVSIAEARKNKWNMAIAIVDTGGYLVYFEKMQDTQTGSVDLAIEKADDPLFRPIDANDFRTKGAAAHDYTNLRHGLIRVSIPLPATLRLIDPQTNLPSSETVADVWRAVPSILNVAISGADRVEPAWRLGPNPQGGYQLDARFDTLQSQAIAALQTHAVALHMPDSKWLDELEAFENAQFSSKGVRGLALAIQENRSIFPDPDPPLNARERRGKQIFKRSCSSCHGSEKHPSTSTVTSPPLTQRYHPIQSACPRPRQRWCAKLGCFRFPACDAALERNVRTYELTLKDGTKERLTTSDPGRLLLSGDVLDVDSFDHSQGVFDIPQLHGIARTAPYFHNNSAATLEDVLTFYQAFFARREVLAPKSAFLNPPFGPFSEAEKPALLAYLRKL